MRTRTQRLMVLAGLTVLVSIFAGLSFAQTPSGSTGAASDRTHRAQGYVFAAPGAYLGYSDSVPTLHIGGGGEALVYRGLGIGAEIGAIGALEESRGGLGLFSLNGSYHFGRRGRAVPFLTGGYSVVGGNGIRNLANFGIGLNYWFRESMGLRLEFRDHFYLDGGARQLLGFRIAFAFR